MRRGCWIFSFTPSLTLRPRFILFDCRSTSNGLHALILIVLSKRASSFHDCHCKYIFVSYSPIMLQKNGVRPVQCHVILVPFSPPPVSVPSIVCICDVSPFLYSQDRTGDFSTFTIPPFALLLVLVFFFNF